MTTQPNKCPLDCGVSFEHTHPTGERKYPVGVESTQTASKSTQPPSKPMQIEPKKNERHWCSDDCECQKAKDQSPQDRVMNQIIDQQKLTSMPLYKPQEPKTEEWEKDYDEDLPHEDPGNTPEGNAFIRGILEEHTRAKGLIKELLSSQKSDLKRRVEGMKQCDDECYESHDCNVERIKDKVLEDVIKEI